VKLSFRLNNIKKMQSKQSTECSVFSHHKTWSNFDRPVLYQTKLSIDSSHMRYDVIVINKTIIDQNSNQIQSESKS
jgi:hypothetical protein